MGPLIISVLVSMAITFVVGLLFGSTVALALCIPIGLVCGFVGAGLSE